MEILDQIQDIEEVESEHGKKRLEWYLQRLRKLNGDIEDGSANAMILSLPWESIGSPEVAREVKKSVFSLGYDIDLMSREADELDHQFRFDWKVYGY